MTIMDTLSYFGFMILVMAGAYGLGRIFLKIFEILGSIHICGIKEDEKK